MTAQTIIDQVKFLLFQQTAHLSRKEYRDLLEDVGSEIDIALEALETDEDSDNDDWMGMLGD